MNMERTKRSGCHHYAFFVTDHKVLPHFHSGYFAISTENGQQVPMCGACYSFWGASGHSLAVISNIFVAGSTKTYLFPLKPGEDLPSMPRGGSQHFLDLKATKARVIDAPAIPAPDDQSYAFVRRTYHRNLYRIPLQ